MSDEQDPSELIQSLLGEIASADDVKLVSYGTEQEATTERDRNTIVIQGVSTIHSGEIRTPDYDLEFTLTEKHE